MAEDVVLSVDVTAAVGPPVTAAGDAAAAAAGAAEPGLAVTLVAGLLVVLGVFFLFTGTVGLLRLPDVYNRMHATSKAATLGASSLLMADVVYFGTAGDVSSAMRALLGVLFLFLTAPTGAHVMSRSAKRMGVPFYGDAEWPEETAESGDDGGRGGREG